MSELIERLRTGEDGLEYAAADEIEELETELQSLRAASEWRSDMENAPKDERILGFIDADTVVILSWFKYNGLEAWRDWDADLNEPTHWRPITPPDSTNTDTLAKMKLTRLKGDVHQILKFMRLGEMDEFKSMEAIDARGISRDLREMADRIEAVAKDYRNTA